MSYITTSSQTLLIVLLCCSIILLFIAFKRYSQSQKKKNNELRTINEQYRLVTDNMEDLVAVLTRDGKYTFVSPSYEKVLGFHMNDLIGKHAFQYLHPSDHDHVSKVFSDFFVKKEKVQFTFRYRHKNGHYVHVESIASPILSDAATVQSVLFSSRNIDVRLKAEKEKVASEEKYRIITENTSDLIRIIEIDKTISYASPSHFSILGYTSAEIVGKKLSQLVVEEDKNKIGINFNTNSKEKVSVIRMKHKKGHAVWIEAKVVPYYDEEGEISHYISTSRDITERVSYEEQLKELAYFDTLTGVANRYLFNDRLTHKVSSANQLKKKFALLSIDCDRFKWVNDTMGHQVGDELLKQFVNRLKEEVRDEGSIFRVGGDEFSIIMPNIQYETEVSALAQKILHAVGSPWKIDTHEFVTTSSIGIAMFPKDGIDKNVLLTHADQALYDAKHKGRNKYSFFTKEMEDRMNRAVTIESSIKSAINNDAFTVVYQPQINVTTDQYEGVESLLRYNDDKLGFVSPAEFIPIAEKTGLINNLTFWIIKKVANDIKWFSKKGILPPRISINISTQTLEADTFYPNLVTLLEEIQLDPNLIEFEITEHALAQHKNIISKTLKALRELGIVISLDDFGVGYSSLSYIKDLPIDKIKIDKSFIAGVPENVRDKALIESIVTLSKQLDYRILCEGVETAEQAEYLTNNGCELAQGYFFSRPLPKEQLEGILKQHLPKAN